MALLLAGCASTPNVTHVDSAGSRTVVTGTGINMQDWNMAAESMINSLRDEFINTRLAGSTEQPSLMAISRIVNNTGVHVDTDMLVKRIRMALLQSGKIVTSTTIGLGGPEDPIADEERRRMRLAGIEPTRPEYTLSGKIIEQTARAGNIREASYIFQLSLTKNPEGFAVWEGERAITKQSKRASVGW